MKDLKKFVAAALVTVASSTALLANADDVYTVVVTGYTSPSNTNLGAFMGGYVQGIGGGIGGGANEVAQRAAGAAIARKACLDAADANGAKCNAAYSQLNSICNSFNAMAGGLAGASAKWFYTKITTEVIDKAVSGMISTGASTAGFNAQDVLVPCSDLTAQATKFCAAGVAKMKASCPQ